MTPRQRVMTALRGGLPDRTPFAVYENKLPQCTAERELRNRGCCVVHKTESYRIRYPHVAIRECRYDDEKGRTLIERSYSTPCGTLTALDEPAGYTVWHHSYPFKTKDDYKALLYILKGAIVEPRYAVAAAALVLKGEDFLVRDELPYEPLQAVMLDWMGTETFCYEWMDNRDEILTLCGALGELNRKVWAVAADGPLEVMNLGGNVNPPIIGKRTFDELYVPHYNEAAEVLHGKGKLLGVHFDGDNTAIMDSIGKTGLDYIEAFDPGMGPSVAEARKAWPGKALWINWPSAMQLSSPDEVRRITKKLMEEASPGQGFIIGITETVPEDRWQMNFSAIMDGI